MSKDKQKKKRVKKVVQGNQKKSQQNQAVSVNLNLSDFANKGKGGQGLYDYLGHLKIPYNEYYRRPPGRPPGSTNRVPYNGGPLDPRLSSYVEYGRPRPPPAPRVPVYYPPPQNNDAVLLSLLRDRDRQNDGNNNLLMNFRRDMTNTLNNYLANDQQSKSEMTRRIQVLENVNFGQTESQTDVDPGDSISNAPSRFRHRPPSHMELHASGHVPETMEEELRSGTVSDSEILPRRREGSKIVDSESEDGQKSSVTGVTDLLEEVSTFEGASKSKPRATIVSITPMEAESAVPSLQGILRRPSEEQGRAVAYAAPRRGRPPADGEIMNQLRRLYPLNENEYRRNIEELRAAGIDTTQMSEPDYNENLKNLRKDGASFGVNAR